MHQGSKYSSSENTGSSSPWYFQSSPGGASSRYSGVYSKNQSRLSSCQTHRGSQSPREWRGRLPPINSFFLRVTGELKLFLSPIIRLKKMALYLTLFFTNNPRAWSAIHGTFVLISVPQSLPDTLIWSKHRKWWEGGGRSPFSCRPTHPPLGGQRGGQGHSYLQPRWTPVSRLCWLCNPRPCWH